MGQSQEDAQQQRDRLLLSAGVAGLGHQLEYLDREESALHERERDVLRMRQHLEDQEQELRRSEVERKNRIDRTLARLQQLSPEKS